ncbi:MAG: hypothetical protein LWX07_06555 [Bacteroidetes bacterium]|nr:hypothetical protein [Bacteroidota bacterium]
MFSLYNNGFKAEKAEDAGTFISLVLKIGENYLRFLVSINRVYLPFEMSPKDAAIDLLAEILVFKNGSFLKFHDFFQNNFTDKSKITEDNYEDYLRGFVYTVIQKNLTNLFKDNDPALYHIYRNIKETAKSLGYSISIHFSDKYLHRIKKVDFKIDAPAPEDLLKLVSDINLQKYIYNTPAFLNLMFDNLDTQHNFCHAVRFHDMAAVMKKIMISDYFERELCGAGTNNFTDTLSIKFIIEEAKFTFFEKLEKYINKNSLSQNFSDCMYSIIDDIVADFMTGNPRSSVRELMIRHFGVDEKSLFYKVQYCVSLFEQEVLKKIKLEKILIDRR